MIPYDSISFSAGQDCGARVAACVARLAALELTEHSRWWNRWRRRLMARALVACAEEMECAADDGTWHDVVGTKSNRSWTRRGLSSGASERDGSPAPDGTLAWPRTSSKSGDHRGARVT